MHYSPDSFPSHSAVNLPSISSNSTTPSSSSIGSGRRPGDGTEDNSADDEDSSCGSGNGDGGNSTQGNLNYQDHTATSFYSFFADIFFLPNTHTHSLVTSGGRLQVVQQPQQHPPPQQQQQKPQPKQSKQTVKSATTTTDSAKKAQALLEEQLNQLICRLAEQKYTTVTANMFDEEFLRLVPNLRILPPNANTVALQTIIRNR